MSKRVYISADYDSMDGDKEVVDQLNSWANDNKHLVDFVDMSKVISGTVANNPDCRICDLKAEFNRQINASSAVIFVVGNKTAERKAGSSCLRWWQRQEEILSQYGLKNKEYGITVCRIEPENNCHLTLEAFSRTGKNLVFIGNWHNNNYSETMFQKYSGKRNLMLFDSIYDLDVLYVLRSHATWYVHGHSAGGTNPSLVEAMFFGRPIIAFDVIYNRETTFGRAEYFSDVDSLVTALQKDYESGSELQRLAQEHYTWNHIARLYETLYPSE